MVAALDLEYVVYGQSDFGKAAGFLTDFGLLPRWRTADELFFRGASSAQYTYVAKYSHRPGLLAIGVRVASPDVLREAATFPEASAVEAIQCPGGGWRVRLPNPDGVIFELVHGIAPLEPLKLRPPLSYNHADRKSRTGSWQRAPLEPARVQRLGHVALLTDRFALNAAWLESRLGMSPSDILFDGNRANSIGGFFHCNAGDGWTDHHSIALFPAAAPGAHHCSFEVQDIDAQFLGHKYLASKGWRPLWGVGRHILGSQIFDYWFDPDMNVVEHFTDGDLVTSDQQPGFHQVSDDSLAQWGPPMPVENFISRLPYENS